MVQGASGRLVLRKSVRAALLRGGREAADLRHPVCSDAVCQDDINGDPPILHRIQILSFSSDQWQITF